MATGLTGGFSPLPPRRSLQELRADILSFVGLPDDPKAVGEADTAIDGACNYLNTRPWRWSVSYQDITTVLNDFDYEINRDLGEAFNLERQNSSGNPDGRLQYKEPKTFQVEHDRAVQSGSPSVYTVLPMLGELILDKAPDQAWVTAYPTLRLWYTRYVYRSETGINVPAHVEHFLLWYARWEMAATHAADRVERAERSWSRIWHEIIRKDNAEVDF